MRRILFRGKRLDNGDWVQGYYFETPLTDEATNSKTEDGWFFLCGRRRHCISRNNCVYEIDPSTVGEFTGHFDTNKKTIFEGDIVECQEYECMGYIAYDIGEAGFMFRVYDDDFPSGYELECLSDFVDEMKIIGNIYDNPELIPN